MTLQRTGQVVCHVKVREVAKAAAGQMYEAYMGADNATYREWKRQNPDCTPRELERRFIEKNWGKCLEFARTTLGLMLRNPEISDTMKDEIMDILEKDQLLRYRTAGKVMH